MKTKLLLIIIGFLQTTFLLADQPTWEIKNYNHEYTYSIQNLRTNGEYVTHLTFQIKSTNPILQKTYIDMGVSDKQLDFFSQDTIQNPSKHFFFDYCITKANRIFAVADSCYLYESKDLGKNWTVRKIIDSSEAITAIAFRDENFGVLVNNGDKLHYTTDGGDNWEKSDVQIDDSDMDILINQKIHFAKDTLFALFYKFSAKKYYSVFSFNSGSTWEEPNPIDVEIKHIKPGLTPGLNKFYFEGSKIWGALYGKTGIGDREISAIIRSDDFGKNWIVLRDTVSEEGYSLEGCAFFDNLQEGLAIGKREMYYTNNGGYNWLKLEGDFLGTDTTSKLNAFQDIIKLNGDLVVSGEDRVYIFRKATSVADGTRKPKEYEMKYLPNSQRLEISSVDKPIESVTIYDLTGKLIFSSKYNSGTFAEVDLSSVNINNVLLIQIGVGGAIYFDKILKEK